MRRKIFFVISSLGAGGSEKVFWLLSQAFDKKHYEVNIVILNSNNSHFSLGLEDVRVLDLKTIKASKSVIKLYKLIKKEKPYAIFSTAIHLNLLVAITSCFLRVPFLVARESNVFNEMTAFGGGNSTFLRILISVFYSRFDWVVCQSVEMKKAFLANIFINNKKVVVIPNPIVVPTEQFVENTSGKKNILIIARLAAEKGHDRLLTIFKDLPDNYFLTVVGEGPLRKKIERKIIGLELENRVKLLGRVTNINQIISQHNLFVLASYTEGFPNVALESLAVGVPVLSFSVSGIDALIKPGFNGYIIEQGANIKYRNFLIKAVERNWDTDAIKKDVVKRFALDSVMKQYERLIN